MTTKLFIATTELDLSNSFKAFNVLRPHLTLEAFLSQVKRQQDYGYQVLALSENGHIVSVAGFRLSEYLAWGKILYIDDLSTLPEARNKGYADRLLSWLIDHATTQACNAVHLDTGHGRHHAHKLYLKKGFQINSHHLSLDLSKDTY